MMIEIMMMVIMMMTIMIMTKILTKIVNAGAKQTMASVLSQWLNLFFFLSLVSETNYIVTLSLVSETTINPIAMMITTIMIMRHIKT